MTFSVIVDFDGTMFDTIETLRCKFKPSVKYSSLTKYGIDKILEISYSELMEWFDRVWMDYRETPPCPDSREVLTRLREAGARIVVATVKPLDHQAAYIRGALEYWNVPYDELVCTKTTVEKFDIYGDWMVDDSPHNAEDARRIGRKMILITRPWNMCFPCTFPIVRAGGWKEVGDVIWRQLKWSRSY